MEKEIEVLESELRRKGQKYTMQRRAILDAFLKTERHLSVEELYRVIKKRYPSIGYATVYRTIKLLCDDGLCEEVDFGDGIKRFEHKYGHEHHDHLICKKCGRFIEVREPKIEKLQEELSRKEGFMPHSHRLQIFGICRKCR